MAESKKNLGGRPGLTIDEKRAMLSKLEPYLKTGLSVRKSLLEAKVPNATFYRVMNDDEWFREQVEAYRNFTSVLLNNAIVRHLNDIIQKQNGNEAKKIKPKPLSRDDVQFLQWYALHSSTTRQEFGKREETSVYDPEAEIQKVKSILEDKTQKQIDGYDPLPDDSDEA